MIKLLVLQSMYGLSDPELERQANDKISFLTFLGFPEKVPDQTTVWYFKERLSKTKKDKAIWNELQRQLEGKRLKIRKGVIQDATFITADPGYASADISRGDYAKTRRNKEYSTGLSQGPETSGFELISALLSWMGLWRSGISEHKKKV
jgi:IS5 family transposase